MGDAFDRAQREGGLMRPAVYFVRSHHADRMHGLPE
jgi:hypothetical protein